MCGIVGVIKFPSVSLAPRIPKEMVANVFHRGPDDGGLLFFQESSTEDWHISLDTDHSWTVALGSRRLAIQDLSEAGHMPMSYGDRYWIVYNGEIYNFVELRIELEKTGHTFRSFTDTEAILAAYAEWGTECFSRFRGMWSMIIFDSVQREVILCRDRLGIKPMYLWQEPGMVAVVSEMKQLLHLPTFSPQIDRATAAEYLRTGYEDAARSFFCGVQSFPPGCWIRLPLSTMVLTTPSHYWYPERVDVTITDAREAGKLFAEKLRESVRLHLRSDVPVGCALSGGMDSSSLALLADEVNKQAGFSLHTFSCTFPGDPLDEQEYVESVNAKIQAMPHGVTPDPALFLQDLDHFLFLHDEPVGSFSMYAGYCLARLTKGAGITVLLSGQGGDELLSGYWQSYYLRLRHLAKRGELSALADHLFGALRKQGNPDLLHQFPRMLRRYFSRSRAASLVPLRSSLKHAAEPLIKKILTLNEQEWRVAQIRDMYLPRLLKWDDRNTMAFSVEGRYPFLDHELIDLCLSFAPETLHHHGWTKWPLRLGLKSVLPEKVLYRRSKFGFEVPQDKWLCGPLRPELERWLRQDRPLWDYVERSDVQHLAHQTWQLNGKRNEPGQALFRLFVFDRWAEIFKVKS